MSVLKPTLSKAYLTLVLLFSFLFSLFFWLYNLTTEDYNLLYLLRLGDFVVPRVFFSLTIPASYVAACVLAVWLTPIWKRKRLWQLTFSKTILAVLFEFIFCVVGWRFILSPLTTLSYTFFPQPNPVVNPCPSIPQYISLCSISSPDVPDYVVISVISLANACISYTLSCFVTDFIKKMKGRKIIRA